VVLLPSLQPVHAHDEDEYQLISIYPGLLRLPVSKSLSSLHFDCPWRILGNSDKGHCGTRDH
jgi:hypothetical protein